LVLRTPRIDSAFSAQGSRARPNPLVLASLSEVQLLLGDRIPTIVDQGCGRLRHLELLQGLTRRLVLVDTPGQLRKPQSLFGVGGRRISQLSTWWTTETRTDIDVLTNRDFQRSHLDAACILSVCVYNVVTPQNRVELAQSAARNLRSDGIYVVIVPRNDHSIIRRQWRGIRVADGHVFRKPGVTTFFANFRDHSPLIDLIESYGLSLVRDASNYRNVWLFFRRASSSSPISSEPAP
jgi:SAM-dependent methyltransferase